MTESGFEHRLCFQTPSNGHSFYFQNLLSAVATRTPNDILIGGVYNSQVR